MLVASRVKLAVVSVKVVLLSVELLATRLTPAYSGANSTFTPLAVIEVSVALLLSV